MSRDEWIILYWVFGFALMAGFAKGGAVFSKSLTTVVAQLIVIAFIAPLWPAFIVYRLGICIGDNV